MNCLLEAAPEGWSFSTYEEMISLFREYCPTNYTKLKRCTDSNGGTMDVSRYCSAWTTDCFGVISNAAGCASAYNKKLCADNLTAMMDCGLTNSSATCNETTFSSGSLTDQAVKDIDEACHIQKFSYFACQAEGGQDIPISSGTTADVCKEWVTRTSGTTGDSVIDCTREAQSYGQCESKYVSVMGCLLNNYGWSWSNFEEKVGVMNRLCPTETKALKQCTDDNGGTMSISDYCSEHKRACNYITELLSTCSGDYGKHECSTNWTAYMDCALEKTDAVCVDTEMRTPSESQIEIIERDLDAKCKIQQFSYYGCKNGL